MAPNASAIKNNLIAAFGISGVNHSDIDNNTACVVHTELSGTNLSPEDIEGVQITITVSKDWFNVVAANEVSNVWIFKINDTTGIVEEIKSVTKVKETNTAITLGTEFGGFSLFALLSKPTPTPAPSKPFGGGSRSAFLPSTSPVPTAIAIPISIETPTLAPTITPPATSTQTPTSTSAPVLRLPPLFLILIVIAIIVIAGIIIMVLRGK